MHRTNDHMDSPVYKSYPGVLQCVIDIQIFDDYLLRHYRIVYKNFTSCITCGYERRFWWGDLSLNFV